MSHQTPWCLKEVGLKNFRCFDEARVELDDSLVVLIGDNGSGKTAVLHGLVVMLSTIVRELDGEGRGFLASDARVVARSLDSTSAVASMDEQYPVVGFTRARLDGVEFEWTRVRQRRQGRTSWARSEASSFAAGLRRRAAKSDSAQPVLPVIAAYGVERLVRDRKGSGQIGPTRFGAYAAALDMHSDMRRLAIFLRDLTLAVTSAAAFGEAPARAAETQLEAIDQACTRVLKGSGWAHPRWRPAGITLTHPVHGVLPLDQLSSGIRIAAGLVIDLASRAARANPALGAERLLEQVPGIVLIDEVDLHLHPSWQQHILQDLQRTFPRVQFVTTTHSPQVLSSVPAHQIRVIDGSDVRHVSHARGLRSDIVLQTVMKTRPEPQTEGRDRLRRYLRLVDAGEGRSEEARMLRGEIESEMGGVETVPELADADAFMLVTGLEDDPD